MDKMYEIKLFEGEKLEVNEVDYDNACLNQIFYTWREDIDGYIIYCKKSDNIDKYKKKLINHLIKEVKEKYDLAKKNYNKLKEIKATL